MAEYLGWHGPRLHPSSGQWHWVMGNTADVCWREDQSRRSYASAVWALVSPGM